MNKISTPIALVTGGAGFIGSHLCRTLISGGYVVRCLDDLSYGSRANIESLTSDPEFQFIQDDVCNTEIVNTACDGAAMIFHMAARKIPRYGDALATLKTNNDGTRNIYDAAARFGCKVMLASTSDVYGKGNPPFKESDDLLIGRSDIRRWAYAVSKIFDEHLALAYHHEQNVDTVIFRFFGSYGPRHHRSWWGGPQSVFIDQVLKGEEITIHGDGQQTRSFTYIDDLIDGIIKAAESKKTSGQILNLGSDEEVTILRLADIINGIINPGQKPKLQMITYESFGGNYEDVRRRIPDLTKAKELIGFGWSTSLRDGLTKTIEWHRQNPI